MGSGGGRTAITFFPSKPLKILEGDTIDIKAVGIKDQYISSQLLTFPIETPQHMRVAVRTRSSTDQCDPAFDKPSTGPFVFIERIMSMRASQTRNTVEGWASGKVWRTFASFQATCFGDDHHHDRGVSLSPSNGYLAHHLVINAVLISVVNLDSVWRALGLQFPGDADLAQPQFCHGYCCTSQKLLVIRSSA